MNVRPQSSYWAIYLYDFMEERISRRPKAGARVNPGGRRVVLAGKTRECIATVEVSSNDGSFSARPSIGGQHESKTGKTREIPGYGRSVISNRRMPSVAG